MSYKTEVLADSPALYWRTGESEGTNANDETANNRDGTYGAGATLAQTSLLSDTSNTAVKLSGASTGRITSAYNPFTSGSTRTFEGWARRTSSTGQDTLMGGDGPPGSKAPVLRLESGAPATVRFYPKASNNATWTNAWPGDNQNVHWVLVFNDSTKKAILYINGESKGEVSTTDAYSTEPGNFVAGAWESTFNQPWHGSVDEIAVYTAALSAARVEAHYAAGTAKLTAPDSVTGAASGITTSAATLNGTVDPNNFDTTYYFEYGTTKSYGSKTSTVEAGGGGSPVAVEAGVSGLSPGTTYHFRVVSKSGAGEGVGADGEFTTLETPPSPTRRVRESPRLDLHYEIETPGSRFYRWGPDEPRPENVPSGSGFTTTDHGGFDTQDLVLPRKPGVSYSDLERLATLRALGPGGEVACETRLKEAPRVSGDQMSVSPVTEGWINHLRDHETAAEVYRDIDLSHFQSPSRARQIALEGGNAPPTGSFEGIADVASGLPALRLQVGDTWASPLIPCAETWYDAGAARIARGYIDWSSSASTSFRLFWISSGSDNEVTQLSEDTYTATTGTLTIEPSAARRYLAFQWGFNATPAGTAGAIFALDLRRLALYGDHGLTLRGTEPEAGYFGSDIIAHALGKYAPLLRFTVGSTGTLRPTTLVIPHLEFREGVSPLTILDATNAFELRPYAVWENRTFHYKDWGEGRKWRARVGPTQLSETGQSTERLRNGIVVRYQDVDGTTRTAGPPESGCQIESAELRDTDPENPANKRGIKMYGPPIDLGIVTVESLALQIGRMILGRLKEIDTSGEAKIVGTCEDDRGVIWPYWKMRAGDTITFVDASNTTERKIIKTSCDDSSKTNTITLDAPPDGVPDLLAQLGVSIADLGL